MLRTVLSAYTGIPAAECPIETDPNGRPRLASASIDFNLSHTRGMIAVAVSDGAAVGVDVEARGRAWSPALARRYFSADEVDALERLPPGARHTRFYELWTLKEAYVKARGLGLAMPLHTFSIRIDDGRAAVTFAPCAGDRDDAWQLRLEHIDDDYLLAVALARDGRDRAIHVRAFQPDEWEGMTT